MGWDTPQIQSKTFANGSHRIIPATETLKRINPIKRKFGISRLANVTGLDCLGIPVALAIRPNSRSVAVSQGKGMTLDDAKASAMMEAIEIWHAEHFDGEVLYGKVKDLKHKHRFLEHSRFPKVVGGEFDDDTPCLWVKGKELVSDVPVLLPYEMIHADYTHPHQPAHGYFPASTNGLASGNSYLEAVCHAITEVVERDSLSLWHFTAADEQTRQRIDPVSVDDENCKNLIERIERAGLQCGIWDVTSDNGIACILCVILEDGNHPGHLGLGSGCHPDRNVALRRALTEAAQTRLNYVSGSRDDLHLDEYSQSGLVEKQNYAEHVFAQEDCPKSFADVSHHSHQTLQEDYDFLLESLKAIDINEIGMVNLTREEHGIPVVRIIIPGLEAPHDDDSYLAGPRAKAIANSGDC